MLLAICSTYYLFLRSYHTLLFFILYGYYYFVATVGIRFLQSLNKINIQLLRMSLLIKIHV